MTAIAADRSHLMRWAASAAVVVGLHALGVAALLAWHDPVGVGGESSFVVDLALYAPPSDSPEDLPRGPIQQQAAMPAPPEKAEPKPEEPEEKVEKIEPEDKIEVPPAPVPPVAALTPPPEAVEPPPPPEPTPQPALPADGPATTAPPREHQASAEEIDAWRTGIATLIESRLVYPAAAQARGQKGVVKVMFSFDRRGRVVSSHVVGASAYAALNQAALETLQKAQPFPPPPAGTTDDTFTFTIPVRFRLR